MEVQSALVGRCTGRGVAHSPGRRREGGLVASYSQGSHMNAAQVQHSAEEFRQLTANAYCELGITKTINPNRPLPK
jgi:hypothetical protein